MSPVEVVPVVKNPPASTGDIRDMGSIPGLGRSPGEGNGTPLQYSCYDPPPRILEIKTKINKWGLINLKSFCTSDFILGSPKSLQMVIAAMKLKDAYSLEGKL